MNTFIFLLVFVNVKMEPEFKMYRFENDACEVLSRTKTGKLFKIDSFQARSIHFSGNGKECELHESERIDIKPTRVLCKRKKIWEVEEVK